MRRKANSLQLSPEAMLLYGGFPRSRDQRKPRGAITPYLIRSMPISGVQLEKAGTWLRLLRKGGIDSYGLSIDGWSVVYSVVLAFFVTDPRVIYQLCSIHTNPNDLAGGAKKRQ